VLCRWRLLRHIIGLRNEKISHRLVHIHAVLVHILGNELYVFQVTGPLPALLSLQLAGCISERCKELAVLVLYVNGFVECLIFMMIKISSHSCVLDQVRFLRFATASLELL